MNSPSLAIALSTCFAFFASFFFRFFLSPVQLISNNRILSSSFLSVPPLSPVLFDHAVFGSLHPISSHATEASSAVTTESCCPAFFLFRSVSSPFRSCRFPFTASNLITRNMVLQCEETVLSSFPHSSLLLRSISAHSATNIPSTNPCGTMQQPQQNNGPSQNAGQVTLECNTTGNITGIHCVQNFAFQVKETMDLWWSEFTPLRTEQTRLMLQGNPSPQVNSPG